MAPLTWFVPPFACLSTILGQQRSFYKQRGQSILISGQVFIVKILEKQKFLLTIVQVTRLNFGLTCDARKQSN
ncbi:hypothetical protein FGO68_gene5769 [Halteria grandinella]|uniref:Uncharacterized protein n=1 Tax=Halteria grandinella TaxID=5974 RepID=A0A8J8SW62_HALGN|nr:hypothetical protein FGO68_gene5769 [Halteria grandinella]